MKVLVIGSSNTEMIFQAPAIPAAGEIVLGSSFSMSPGGRGLNQAIAAARAGGEVVYIGRTGNDLFGEQIIQVLQQDNIDTSYVIRDKTMASGISSIVVDAHGESGITITPGANINLSDQDILKTSSVISSAEIVLLQLDIPIETVRFAADLAGSSGARIILNPTPALPVSDELLKSISILTPSASQAEILTGITITDERSAELAGRILLERGLSRVIITLRSKGAMVIDNGGAEHVPGFEMLSIDASLVNDVFNGALVVALSEGKNFYEAVLFANAAAAISASRQGALSSIPYRQDILEVLRIKKRIY
jgi:ribokinase